jgi:hypothetical protein
MPGAHSGAAGMLATCALAQFACSSLNHPGGMSWEQNLNRLLGDRRAEW